MLKYNLILLMLISLYNTCGGYKLLVAFPFASPSHTILGEGYVRNLLAAGHEVTYITPIPTKKTHPKLRQVDVSSTFNIIPMDDVLNLEKLLRKEVNLGDLSIMLPIMLEKTEGAVLHENVQKLLHDPKEEFDAVIAEWMFSEIYSGFSSVFGCPLIWSSSMDPHTMVLSLIDEAPNPAYVPDQLSSFIPPFLFLERVTNLWYYFRLQFHRWINSDREIEIYEKAFTSAVVKRGRTLPPLFEIKYNASLMLGNSHVAAGQAIRLPQNYIPILGYHISDEVIPLPEDLKKILDNATDGVIYFSMGSNLKSKDLPTEIKKSLLKMFGELKQTVLWKFEEVLPDLPKNVHILKWAPQQSILSHPNCVLFITHGGLLSTTETLHFGVPIIGIPVFADQFVNVARAVNKGFAKKVDLSYNMAETLKFAIEDILTNPIYHKRVKELSMIYHDRPVSPGRELVHWVEHVVKTGGAPHLRSPALSVPLYQKLYLDLAAVVLVVLFVSIYAIKYLFVTKKQLDTKKKNN